MLVTVALIAPLLLALGVLAHARRSEDARRNVIDETLRQYAAIAAWQLAEHLGDGLHELATHRLNRSLPGDPLMTLRRTPANGRCLHCDALPPDSARFEYDPRTTRVRWSVARPTTPLDGKIGSLVAAELKTITDEPHRTVFAVIEGKARALLLNIPAVAPHVVTGVDVPASVLGAVVDSTLAHTELLPTTLARPPFGRDRMRVSITLRDSTPVIDSLPEPAALPTASDTTAQGWGALVVHVALMPALANDLMPPTGAALTSGVLLALLGLSSVLAAAAMIHLRRARELERLRTRFVANVSHELRTPLTQISMFAETLALARERSSVERHEFASVIHREARRLTTLVDSVLRFARADASRLSLHIEPRPIRADLSEALDAFAPLARGSAARTSLVADPDLHAMADAGALRQIVLNLLDNAVKYGPDGQDVTVRAVREDAFVRITVEDQGPGIEAADRERVFDAFVRVSEKAAGTGIGLSVVRDLVAALGGRVWIESNGGRGTRVCVLLQHAVAVS